LTSENDSAFQDLDLSNPRSLLNLVSENLRLRIAEIPDEFLNRKEHEIINLCYSDEPDGRPGAIDSVLRRNFWDEYNRVLADELPAMLMKNIYQETCSLQTFNRILHDYKRLAYIITEPHRDKVKSQYALDCVWEKIIKLAKMDPEISTKTGLPDSKVWDLQLKLFQFLEQQKHGSLIHRIKQETTNLNVEVDGNKVIAQANTEEEVRKILEQVKARLSILPTPPQPQIEPRLVLPTEIAHRDAKKAEVER